MIRTRLALASEQNDEIRQVPDVDHLERVVRRSWREDLTATGEALDPVGEAVGVVVRTGNVRRADDADRLAEPVVRGLLAECLQAAVGMIVHLLCTWVVQYRKRQLLGPARRRRRGVRRHRRNVHVVTATSPERIGESMDLARHVSRRVDGGIPLASRQGREVAVAVAKQVVCFGEQVRIRLAAI